MNEKVLYEFIKNSAESIFGVDREGKIVFWNIGAEGIFGFTSEEAIGSTLDIIIPEKLRKRHWEGFNRVIETGKSKYRWGELLSVPAITKEGEKIFVEFTITVLKDESDDIEYIFAVMRKKEGKK